MYRKLILGTIMVIFGDYDVFFQGMMAVAVLVISLILHIKTEPWEDSMLNFLEKFSLLIVSLVLYLGLFAFANNEERRKYCHGCHCHHFDHLRAVSHLLGALRRCSDKHQDPP